MDRLHFKGDRREFDTNKVIGPDMFGGWHRPVSARYDSDTDTTTRFYQPVPYKDLPKNMQALSSRVIASRKDQREWVREIVDVFLRDTKWSSTLQRFLDLLQSGVRPKRAAPADDGLTKSQRESRDRLKKRGLSLPKSLDAQGKSGLVLLK